MERASFILPPHDNKEIDDALATCGKLFFESFLSLYAALLFFLLSGVRLTSAIITLALAFFSLALWSVTLWQRGLEHLLSTVNERKVSNANSSF